MQRLARRPFKAKIEGSNPSGVTTYGPRPRFAPGLLPSIFQIEGYQIDLPAEGRQIAWSASLSLGVESRRGYHPSGHGHLAKASNTGFPVLSAGRVRPRMNAAVAAVSRVETGAVTT